MRKIERTVAPSVSTRVAIRKEFVPIPLNQEQKQNLKIYGTLNRPETKQTELNQGRKVSPGERMIRDKKLAKQSDLEEYQKRKEKEAKDLEQALVVAPYLIPGIGQAMWAGKAVDLAVSGASDGKYKSWGNMVDQKTGSGEFIGELTNPGYSAGLVGKVASPLIKKGIQSSGEYLTTKTPLKDAWKLNPYSYKPNPDSYFRGIGKTGYDDALKTGVLRSPEKSSWGNRVHTTSQMRIAEQYSQNSRPWMFKDNSLEIVDAPLPKGFSSKSYIAEIPRTSLINPNNPDVYSKDVFSKGYHEFVNPEPIPINDVRFLKQHWLSRYKDITPKTTIHFQSK